MVEAAAIIGFMLGGTDQDMLVPIVEKVAHVADGNIYVFVFYAAFDESGKAVIVAPDIDEFPIVFPAKGAEMIYVFVLKRFVIFPDIAAGGKVVCKI